MNEITRAAAALAEGGVLLGIMTTVFMTFFVGVVLRLWGRSSDEYDEAAALALHDD